MSVHLFVDFLNELKNIKKCLLFQFVLQIYEK